MKKENEIFNWATDVANCVPVASEGKRSVRTTVLRIAVLAIQAYREDPSIAEKLETMADYSG